MAMLEDIKQKITALSPGKYQNLCDAYLNEKGYSNIVSLGSKPGTEKVTKGTPDTYCFLDSDKKYIFIEYTTQQNNLYDKIMEDLRKCLNYAKTNIVTTDISTIFYFHTTSNLTPSQDSKLKQYCSSKGVELYIIGIDMLANEIFNNYKGLAKEYLDISISTEQILTKNEFIEKYNKSKTAASISTKFMFRETEFSKITSVFSECNIALICGAAGVGKTRLAMEYAEHYSISNGALFYCIRNNNLPLYNDLHLFFNKAGKYIILIDDANELANLTTVIEFFRDRPSDFEIKILITVRNYALQTVKSDILHIEDFKEVTIDTFSDEEIEAFLKSEFNIFNSDYIYRIISISEGNARIAYLAGKIACENNSLNAINDLSDVYSIYYEQYLPKYGIIDNRALIIAGVAAFIDAINLDYLDKLKDIFEIAGITETEFKDTLQKLHYNEILDIYKNKAVKFSDQCLSNYLLKYVFLDKKLISISNIVKCYFVINKNRTISSMNVLINCFCNDSVYDYIKSEIRSLWDELEKGHSPFFWEFVKAFYHINNTATLIILLEKVEAKSPLTIQAEKIDVNKNKNYQFVTDDILEILGGYANTNELKDALDIYFKYYLKCPALYIQFYHTANLYYNVNKNNYRHSCYTINTYLEKMIEYSENWSNEYIAILFLDIASEFLKLAFHETEATRNDKVYFTTYSINDTNGIKKYRTLIWNSILYLAESKKYFKNIIKVLNSYGAEIDEKNSSVVNYDSKYLMQILDKLYIQNEFETSILCVHIKKVFDYAKLSYDSFFDNFFANADFQVFKYFKSFDYDDNMEYEEWHEAKKQNIKLYIQNCSELEFTKVIDMCKKFCSFEQQSFKLTDSLNQAFDIVINTKDYFASAIRYYLKCDTPGNILSPIKIVSQLFEKLGDKDVWDIICCCDFQSKNYWKYAYFHELPSQYIDKSHTEALYTFLKDDSDKNIASSTYRDVMFLNKYQVCDSNVFINGCKTIFNKKDYSVFIVNIYFSLLFNSHVNNPKCVIELFNENYQLLEDIYLVLLERDELIDCDGEFFKEFYIVNHNILSKCVTEKSKDFLCKKSQIFIRLFELENYIEIVDLFIDKFLENTIKPSFCFENPIEEFFTCNSPKTITQKNMDKWLEHYIIKNNNNSINMEIVFDVISKFDDEKKIKYIGLFLEYNKDYNSFALLPLFPNSYSWSGSEVPLIQKEIDYLKKLLTLFTGITWIKHKKYIEDLIEEMNRRIERAEINEILYDI